MTNHPDTTNVLPLTSDVDVEARAKVIRAFSERIAEYHAITAAWRRGVPDEEFEALAKKQCDLIWQIVRTPAPGPTYIDEKLELLRELIQTDWVDCRNEALLESIRYDVQASA